MKKLASFLALLSGFFIFPGVVFAQSPFSDWGDCVEPVLDSSGKDTGDRVATLRCLPVVFKNVIAAFLIFVGAVAIFLIIWSGIQFINSGGDPKKTEAARKMMTYAIIGAIVVLSSFAILYFVGFITKSTPCITNVDAIANGGCK